MLGSVVCLGIPCRQMACTDFVLECNGEIGVGLHIVQNQSADRLVASRIFRWPAFPWRQKKLDPTRIPGAAGEAVSSLVLGTAQTLECGT